jgi:nucleotide sugar dehydrogenase
MLEEASGLVAGRDFHLAYSPERTDPGNADFRLANTPKVVGGLTAACAERAAGFYQRLVATVVRVRGTREAEMAKLLENAYRHVNIAFVNEMAQLCHGLGIDFWDVVRAAASKPFGFQSFRPGPGVGGHCIPVDPHYLSHHVRSELGLPVRFVELAHEVNSTMPAYVARRGQDLLNNVGKAVNGATVLLLGVSYKPNVSDSRQSPAAPLARQLSDLGAKVSYHDPRITDWTVPDVHVSRVIDLEAEVVSADLVILLQPHDEYETDRLAALARQFFDTCGVTASPEAHRL